MAGLLDGMRVLDFSVWRPMPHATQILADLGAEVLKVEPPGGDPMRAYPDIFASVARGKRSIVLNLRSADGRARALALAGDADVVCEGWRPGVAERLGVDHATVVAVNPAVIYCSVSGYGQSGPMRDRPGHDVNFQALGGALAARLTDDAAPRIPRLPVADLESGTLSALLICAAWARRAHTGLGERIDVAMADVVAWWVGAHDPPASGATGSPGYGLFRTRDDRWLALGVLSEARLWEATCRALDLDHLAATTFEERLARTDEVNQVLTDRIAQLDRNDALGRLVDHGAPVSPVLSAAETSHDPHFRARALHVETIAGPVAALPALLASGGRVVPTALPAIDQHPEGWALRDGTVRD